MYLNLNSVNQIYLLNDKSYIHKANIRMNYFFIPCSSYKNIETSYYYGKSCDIYITTSFKCV